MREMSDYGAASFRAAGTSTNVRSRTPWSATTTRFARRSTTCSSRSPATGGSRCPSCSTSRCRMRHLPARQRFVEFRAELRRIGASGAQRVARQGGRRRGEVERVSAAPCVRAHTAADEEPKSDGRQGWLLAVCCVAQFMVILDLSIVNVALPAIQSDLDFSSSGLQVGGRRLRDHVRGLVDGGGRATDRLGAARVRRRRAVGLRGSRRWPAASLGLRACSSSTRGCGPERRGHGRGLARRDHIRFTRGPCTSTGAIGNGPR